MSVDFDAVVVGAGVVGLAVARELSGKGRSVLVLEKAARAGTETSSRNSEVIHAGIYYPQGSMKARTCVEGRGLLYDYCASRGVGTKRLGKLIVATSAAEEAKLENILALAYANGVEDLQWLSPSEVSSIEPEVRCTKALLSPSTGIIDAQAYMMALQADTENTGGNFAFNTCFVGAKHGADQFTVTTADAVGEKTDISCRWLINSAGLWAHEVAMAIAGLDQNSLPPRFLAKGSYCSVSGGSPFTHLVYPVPVAGALGIHATIDMGGAIRFGPDITWIERIDYSVSADIPGRFSAAVANYWPGVRDRALVPSYCGIRPKLHGPHEAFADFKIQSHNSHGVHGLVNLFGVESPGITASLAIAREVERCLLT